MKHLFTWFAAAIIALLVSSAYTVFAEDMGKRRPARKPFAPSKIEKILESPQREQWQQPDRVIATLGLKNVAVVADIGAGSGYFTFLLAEAVGAAGKVYAVDIQEEMLEYIRQKMSRTGVMNIIPVKSTETDPRLPSSSCDRILLVNTYHELTEPIALMKNLRKALKPGGIVAIINWRKMGKMPSISSDEIIEDMQIAGFVLSATHDFLERQYFLVFNPLN